VSPKARLVLLPLQHFTWLGSAVQLERLGLLLRKKGKEERDAATVFSVDICGIKRQREVCPPSFRASPLSELDPAACVCFFRRC